MIEKMKVGSRIITFDGKIGTIMEFYNKYKNDNGETIIEGIEVEFDDEAPITRAIDIKDVKELIE